jgi:hypothetical protein
MAEVDNLPRQFLIGNVIVNVQWHHVINIDSFNNSDLLKELQARGLWSQESVARNIIPLGADEASAAVSRLG